MSRCKSKSLLIIHFPRGLLRSAIHNVVQPRSGLITEEWVDTLSIYQQICFMHSFVFYLPGLHLPGNEWTRGTAEVYLREIGNAP